MLFLFPAMGEASERVHGVRAFLSNGEPDQAIRTSEILLSTDDLEEDERFELFSLIADAQEMKAKVRHYNDIEAAVLALNTLKKEFPQKTESQAWLWRMLWLHWKHGDQQLAIDEATMLRIDFPQSPEAIKAAMIMSRIYIEQHKWNDARASLIQYGLHAAAGSHEESLAKAWIAIVDMAEERFSQALTLFQWVDQHEQDIFQQEPQLFASYIKLLHIMNHDGIALQKAEMFLDKYYAGEDVAAVRLLRADLWLQEGKVDVARIEQEYDALARMKAEEVLGKQAFMRKLMLANRQNNDYRSLKPVIIALKRLANENQLSVVENEAWFDLALLWQRLSEHDAEHAPKQAMTLALDYFSRVAGEDIDAFGDVAFLKGQALFEQQLGKTMASKTWTQTVALWERFPQLRREHHDTNALQLGVAHALRMLMQYDQSEDLLNQLYRRSQGSVWGQKVLLEQARLWLDRRDARGVEKVLQWLNAHQFTLYRPELMLLVAQMQLQAGNASAASQSLVSIAVSDIAFEERDTYWKTQAEIAESLQQWHVAAHAWREYEQTAGVDIAQARLFQANALFKANSYGKAEALYAQVSEDKQDAAWRYKYSICQLKTGKKTQALERLERLSKESGAGVYASLGALVLAENKADQLVKEHP